MKALLLILSLSLSGCLVIEEDDGDARYYRPGSRYYGVRPYVESQQYYAPGPYRRQYYDAPRRQYYEPGVSVNVRPRTRYTAPAEVYDDRRWLRRDDRRRYYDDD